VAFIPSKALEAVLDKARVGVWIELLHDGRIALVCKIPETIIKALHRGAGCSFLLSVVRAKRLDILCLGLRVQDEPEHPFTATHLSLSPEDLALLKEILACRGTTLHCLNELNHPVLSASCSLESAAAQSTLKWLNSTNPYLLTPTGRIPQPSDMLGIVDLALDRFQKEVYRSESENPSTFIKMTGRIPLALEIWRPQEVFEVSPTVQGGPFRIDDEDEGKKLEMLLHLPIDTIYPSSTYRSPTVRDGSTTRELTDVLGFDAKFICLLESKALSVLTGATQRSSQRRAATVTKHVTKALKQLRGALTSIRSGAQVFDADSQPIAFTNQQTSPAHAIVLLSEMYFFLDWKRIAREVSDASDDDRHRALFHVFDLLELNYLVANSKDATAFNNLLIHRWLAARGESSLGAHTRPMMTGV
jgi:hypothetical protein